MSERERRERLVELLQEWGNKENDGVRAESIADYLLDNDIIVPPVKVDDTLYMIVEKRSKISREYFHFIKKD